MYLLISFIWNILSVHIMVIIVQFYLAMDLMALLNLIKIKLKELKSQLFLHKMILNLLLPQEVKMTLKNAVLPIIQTVPLSFLFNNRMKTPKHYRLTSNQIQNLPTKKSMWKVVSSMTKMNFFNKKINYLKNIIIVRKILNLNKT